MTEGHPIQPSFWSLCRNVFQNISHTCPRQAPAGVPVRMDSSRFTSQNIPFFFFLMFIGVELIYNVVLVSGVQQRESVIHTHISTPF